MSTDASARVRADSAKNGRQRRSVSIRACHGRAARVCRDILHGVRRERVRRGRVGARAVPGGAHLDGADLGVGAAAGDVVDVPCPDVGAEDVLCCEGQVIRVDESESQAIWQWTDFAKEIFDKEF